MKFYVGDIELQHKRHVGRLLSDFWHVLYKCPAINKWLQIHLDMRLLSAAVFLLVSGKKLYNIL